MLLCFVCSVFSQWYRFIWNKMRENLLHFFVKLQGIQAEITGSTMLSLARQVGINFDQMGWIIASRSIGFMISVIFFGLFFQSIINKNPTLLLSIAYIFPAIGTMNFLSNRRNFSRSIWILLATGTMPFWKSLWSLSLSLFIQGLLHGISDLGKDLFFFVNGDVIE